MQKSGGRKTWAIHTDILGAPRGGGRERKPVNLSLTRTVEDASCVEVYLGHSQELPPQVMLCGGAGDVGEPGKDRAESLGLTLHREAPLFCT